ncbi:MAG TPA: DUF6788 family protein [Trebonia sp.]|nr:DUF6788 family protein [Trebonia sp.]
MPPTPDQQAQAQAIAAEITARLAGLTFALPGTVADRMTRCGRANCRCHADPPRPAPPARPYHHWTRKKNGKTATKILTDDQLADYAPWFDNHKRIRSPSPRASRAAGRGPCGGAHGLLGLVCWRGRMLALRPSCAPGTTVSCSSFNRLAGRRLVQRGEPFRRWLMPVLNRSCRRFLNWRYWR